MAPRALASPALRRAGLDAVLGFAWDAGVFTASEAMEGVGLTRSTTIDVIDELVGRGLLRELPNAREAGQYRKGRPSRRFELRAEAGTVVGVDAGHAHVTVMLADLRGATIATHRVALARDQDSPEGRLATTAAAVDHAVRGAGLHRSAVLALCVGVPAPVDVAGSTPPHRDGFWRRMDPGFAAAFSTWVPAVRVENDARLAAVAERAVGAAEGCEDFVALLAGERLGAGVCVDGRLLRGAHGGVGEMIAFAHVAGVEGAWGLGHRAAQWAREALQNGSLPAESALAGLSPGQIDGRLVLTLAAAGDPGALPVAHRLGDFLAVIAGVMGSLFDSRRIIVSGAVAANAAPVIEAARAALPTELDLPAPEIVASTLGADVVSIGAVSAAREDARTRVLDLPAFAAVPATDGDGESARVDATTP